MIIIQLAFSPLVPLFPRQISRMIRQDSYHMPHRFESSSNVKICDHFSQMVWLVRESSLWRSTELMPASFSA